MQRKPPSQLEASPNGRGSRDLSFSFAPAVRLKPSIQFALESPLSLNLTHGGPPNTFKIVTREETSAIAAPCPTTRSDWGASFPPQAKPRKISISSKVRMRTLVPCSTTSGPIHGNPVPPSHGKSLKTKSLFSQKYPALKSACSKSRMILPDA